MTTFAVTTEHLDHLVSEMEAFTARVHDHIAELDERINTMHVTWSGAAADAHRQAYAKQKEGLHEMLDGLRTMQNALHTAKSNYTKAVTENTRRMEGL